MKNRKESTTIYFKEQDNEMLKEINSIWNENWAYFNFKSFGYAPLYRKALTLYHKYLLLKVKKGELTNSYLTEETIK